MSALHDQHMTWMAARARLTGVLPPSPKEVAVRPRSPFHRERHARNREWEDRGYLYPLIAARCEAHYSFEIAHARAIKPRWRKILEEVAADHSFTVEELLSRRRNVKLVHARHEAMWRMKNETSLSLPDIGDRCGGRDHTTAMWGIRQHEARLSGKELRRAA